MARILTRCPVCEGVLGVTELQCRRCKTTISSTFETCRFCRLAPEHLAFVELFLRCEGNLSRVEKELNLSYPTVRNRFQAALVALGFNAADSARSGDGGFDDPLDDVSGAAPRRPGASAVDAERRREVLEALAQGDMSAEDAAEALRDLV